MKEIKLNDVCWCVEHSVYGNPNSPLNEPKLIPFKITKIENGYYHGYGTDAYGVYTKPEKYVFKTVEEGLEYIKEHKNEIIKESFEEHKKWFEKELKKARRR